MKKQINTLFSLKATSLAIIIKKFELKMEISPKKIDYLKGFVHIHKIIILTG